MPAEAGGKPEGRRVFRFEAGGRAFALDLAELSAVVDACPFASYEGLPASVCGIVLWGGKVFPVLDLWKALGVSPQRNAVFAFCAEISSAPFREFAVEVPADARVVAVESSRSAPDGAPRCISGIISAADGSEALLIRLATVAMSRAA